VEKFKNAVGFAANFVDGQTEVISTAFSSTTCRRLPAGGKTNRLLGVANSYSNGGQIVNNVLVT